MEQHTLLPTFKLEKSAKENFDKYMTYMNRPELKMDDLKRGRWTYEMYLKSCNVAERERRQQEKESIVDLEFEIEGAGKVEASETRTRKGSAQARK